MHCFAAVAFISSIPTQIECSEELCVIRITFIFLEASASNSLLEKPGIPTIPLPSRLSKAMLLMLEIPVMLLVLSIACF